MNNVYCGLKYLQHHTITWQRGDNVTRAQCDKEKTVGDYNIIFVTINNDIVAAYHLEWEIFCMHLCCVMWLLEIS